MSISDDPRIEPDNGDDSLLFLSDKERYNYVERRIRDFRHLFVV